MRKPIYFTILFAICSLPYSNITAQETAQNGYIISAQGDTLIGQVLLKGGKNKYKEVIFIQSSNATIYTADQILGYQYDGKFLFEKDSATNAFRNVLIRSKMLSLYKTNENYIIIDSDGMKVILNDKSRTENINGELRSTGELSWKAKIAKIAKDCITDTKYLQSIKLNNSDIIQFVKDFNECKGTSSEEYSSLKPQAKMHVGPVVHFYSVTSRLAANPEIEAIGSEGANTVFMGGISADLFFKNTNQRIAINGEILLSKNDVVMSEVSPRAGGLTIFSDFFVKTTSITAPLTLKYNLTRQYPRPYISAGGVVEVPIKNELIFIQQKDANGTVNTKTIDVINPPNSFFGLQFGAGCKLKFGKTHLVIEANYQSVNELNDNTNYNISHDRVGGGIKVLF